MKKVLAFYKTIVYNKSCVEGQPKTNKQNKRD